MSITTRKKNMRREKREVKRGERLIRSSLLYEFLFVKVPGTSFGICIQLGVANTCRPHWNIKDYYLLIILHTKTKARARHYMDA
jgi:hypothetical protein